MPSIPKTNTLNLLKIQCICLYDQHNAEYIQCVCSVSAVALLFLLGSHICEATCMAVCPLKRPSFLLLACTSAVVLHASASTTRIKRIRLLISFIDYYKCYQYGHFAAATPSVTPVIILVFNTLMFERSIILMPLPLFVSHA